MVFTLLSLLLIAAFVTVIVAAMGKCPLWVSVLLVVVIQLLTLYPGR